MLAQSTRLSWDSSFFGFGVARIDAPELSAEALTECLESLRAQDVSLVYWAAAHESAINRAAAEQCAARLVDLRTTYRRALGQSSEPRAVPSAPIELSVYESPHSCAALDQLAIETGVYSRFATDPRISTADYERLYRTWIANSVNGQLAEKVLVLRDTARSQQPIVGYITLATKGGYGDIGLLAVHSDYRGKSLGRCLVDAALAWSREHGHERAQVITHARSTAACRLYEACGYQVALIEAYYHIWLD